MTLRLTTYDDRVEVETDDGMSLATYDWRSRNHPYVHPLRPLTHRGLLTNHAPWDHRWHHGLWWSWKFVDEVLFWEDHPGYGGATAAGLGRSTVIESATQASDQTVKQRLEWTAERDGRTLLDERRTLRFHTEPHGLRGTWAIDWDLAWTARSSVELRATPFPEVAWGGYGGLNYRPARSLAQAERLRGEGGRCGATELHGLSAGWASYSGCVDGAGDDEPDHPARGGVALLQHPANPAFPAPCYAWPAEQGFGFLAIAPVMHAPLQLAPAESMQLRFRALVLGDDLPHEELDEASRAFGGEGTDG